MQIGLKLPANGCSPGMELAEGEHLLMHLALGSALRRLVYDSLHGHLRDRSRSFKRSYNTYTRYAYTMLTLLLSLEQRVRNLSQDRRRNHLRRFRLL